MKECSPLYPSIAIEALTGLVMGLLFLYLWIKISTRNDLKSPAGAVYRLATHTLFTSMRDLKKNMGRWTLMPKGTMGERFAFCRKCNQAILLFQAFVAFISITRWLHIGNINGFRYLGYAITCPPMQAQLILLIAPIVPCYRICLTFTFLVTFCQLIIGWIASARPEPLLNCGWEGLIAWDETCFEYTQKFWTIVPAIINQVFLSFVQIPCLGLLYLFKGGGNNPLLPPGYLKLLFIVAFTWLGFPAWWFCSFEGMGLLTDTKLNAVGFAVLNVISKGALAFQVLNMVTMHRQRQAARGDKAARSELGMSRMRSGSTDSVLSGRDVAPPSENRASLSAWAVRFLRNFDDGAQAVPPSVTSMPPVPGTPRKEATCPDDTEFEPGPFTRQSSADSQGSGTALIVDSGLETLMWEGLEPMYRRFLKDCGVTQSEFAVSGMTEKVELRTKFEQVTSTVFVDAEGMKIRSMPQWAEPGSITLADATDAQILKEMQRRLTESKWKITGNEIEEVFDTEEDFGTADGAIVSSDQGRRNFAV